MEFEVTKENLDYTVQVVAAPSKMEVFGAGRQSPNGRAFVLAQLALRASVVALTLAAIIVTVTDKQTVNIAFAEYKARYTDSSAIRFQVGANAVVCALSFLSMLLVPVLVYPKSHTSSYFYLHLHDLVITILSMSGCAASSAVGYLANKGQEQGNWMAVCKYMGKFCNKLERALALSYLAFFCLLALTVMAAYKLKSQINH